MKNRLRLFVLVLVGLVLVVPLTYSGRAHAELDRVSRQLALWHGELIGPDLSMPRQNIFSLFRDLGRTVTVVDHATVRYTGLVGVVNFFSRGSIATVGDLLAWLDIPLTVRQARALDPCMTLDEVGEDRPIVISPDPWQRGIASWYGPGFHGQLAASGEIYNMYARTAAHKTLPLGSRVRVVAARTGITTVVRINDRGPYVPGRVVDLSYTAKRLLGMDDLVSVYLERLDPTALDISCP